MTIATPASLFDVFLLPASPKWQFSAPKRQSAKWRVPRGFVIYGRHLWTVPNVDAKSQLQVRTGSDLKQRKLIATKPPERVHTLSLKLVWPAGQVKFFCFHSFIFFGSGMAKLALYTFRILTFTHRCHHRTGPLTLQKMKCQPQIMPATWGDEIESNACKIKPARHSSNYANRILVVIGTSGIWFH